MTTTSHTSHSRTTESIATPLSAQTAPDSAADFSFAIHSPAAAGLDESAGDANAPAGTAPAVRRRVVVLTGASSGIGRATAQTLARHGACIVLAARDRAALESVAAECVGQGAETLVVPTDVTDADAMVALADAAIARFGHIDAWINNVGVGAVGLFDATPMEAHRRVIEANLIGHMNGAHAVLPHFRARGRGTLVNMISLGGFVSAPYASAYTASKFGLRGFSESLRGELSALRDVYVCEVFPTFVDTPGMTHGANYTGRHISAPPPLVDPRRVATALATLALARRPRARTYIGGPALPGILAHALAPNVVVRTMMLGMKLALGRAEQAPITDGNLHAPSHGHAVDGGFREANRPTPETAMSIAAVALGAIALLAMAMTRKR